MKKSGWAALGLLLFALLTYGREETTPPVSPVTHTVVIEAMKFTPETLSVHTGDLVVFRNADLVPHTVTERSERLFDSKDIPRNQTWTLVVGDAGTFHYRCIYHPTMMGTIVVERTSRSVSVQVSAAVQSSDPIRF